MDLFLELQGITTTTTASNEYTAWVTPDTNLRGVLPKYTGLKNIHIEMLRFTTQGTGGRHNQQSVNKQTLAGSSVFELSGAYFNPDSYLQNPENLNWLKQNYTVYIDIAAAGYMINDMINNNLQSQTVSAIVNFAKAQGVVGVETNFETLGDITSANMPKYVQFLKDLGNSLHQNGLKFRYTTMSEIVGGQKTAFVGAWRNSFIKDLPYDEVCMMSYDEQYDTLKAIASFDFIRKSLEALIADGIPANKIIQGIPNYGYVKKNSANNFQLIDSLPMKKLMAAEISKLTQRDPLSGELYNLNASVAYRVGETPVPGSIWMNDHTSIRQKMDVGKALGVNNFGLWVAMEGFDYFEPIATASSTTPTVLPTINDAYTTTQTTDTGSWGGAKSVYTYPNIPVNLFIVGYGNISLSKLVINDGEVQTGYTPNTTVNSITIKQSFTLRKVEILNNGPNEVYIEAYAGDINGDVDMPLVANDTVLAGNIPEPTPSPPDPIIDPVLPPLPTPPPEPTPSPEPTPPPIVDPFPQPLPVDEIRRRLKLAYPQLTDEEIEMFVQMVFTPPGKTEAEMNAIIQEYLRNKGLPTDPIIDPPINPPITPPPQPNPEEKKNILIRLNLDIASVFIGAVLALVATKYN